MNAAEGPRKDPSERGATRTLRARLAHCVAGAGKPALRTGFWLLKITVPVSLAVWLLQRLGAIAMLARLTRPLFNLFGLPGEAAVVFATGALLNNYSAIAVMKTLGMDGRATTILALMCLISHNLPVEIAVQRKTGSSFGGLLTTRLACSCLAGIVLNLALPGGGQSSLATVASAAQGGQDAAFFDWLAATAQLCMTILGLVFVLTVLQRALEEFGAMRPLTLLLKTPLALLGVPHQAAFLWIVANSLGLAYGAGALIEHAASGRLSRRNADILNYHIAVSHSLLEDTLLYVAIGAQALWITLPRLLLAAAAAWLRRGWLRFVSQEPLVKKYFP